MVAKIMVMKIEEALYPVRKRLAIVLQVYLSNFDTFGIEELEERNEVEVHEWLSRSPPDKNRCSSKRYLQEGVVSLVPKSGLIRWKGLNV